MKRRDVFEELEPPAGGLAKLRERIADGRPSLWPRWALAGAIAAGVAGFVLVDRPVGALVATARAEAGASEVGLGLARAPEEPLTLDDESRQTSAVMEVPTSDPRVVLYLVATVP